MRKVLTLILLLLCTLGCYAQTTDRSVDNDRDFKNALVFTAGTTVLDIPFIPSFQYERTLFYGKKNKKFMFGINTGYTRYKPYKENIYHLRLYTLIGRYAAKFEFSIGVAHIGHYQKYTDANNTPYTVYEAEFSGAMNIGFRYQKEGSQFLFRFGVGAPEILYLGVGFRF